MESAALDAEVRDYDVGVFQRLNEFGFARDRLEENRDSLHELGDLICLHGLHERIGVSLLHKHFEISDNELVVREFIDNVSYIRPWKVDRQSSPSPYLWKAEINGERAIYYPLEFCDYPDHLNNEVRSDLEILKRSSAFLTQFANKLEEFGLIEIFGLMSLRSRDGLILQEGETLLETTDEERRILTLRPAQVSEIEGIDTTQTLWIYRPAPRRIGAAISGTTCAAHCAGHCLAHC
ncbi:MAG TPA: hypothetical protein VGP70_14110 [Actinomadura sp.]|nr:hypothetical protein [Actinomadura sp.]